MRNRYTQKSGENPPFQEALEPEMMRKKLWCYRRELGREFGLPELLKLEDIRAKTRLAEVLQGFSADLFDRNV